ncbi:MAG: ComEC/Rec2 family competence protein [Bacilli bacterium]
MRQCFSGTRASSPKSKSKVFPIPKTMHVFAISGLHIGFAAALIYALLRSKTSMEIQPLVALPVLYMHVCACGGGSAMRAFAMIAVLIAMVSAGE